MPPPTDSVFHQAQKLQEEARTLSPRHDRRSPPPPYTRAESRSPLEPQNGALAYEESNSIIETIPPPSHITVHIDASISISGNQNTIILPGPSSKSEPKFTINSGTTTTNNPHKQQQNQQPTPATRVLAMREALQSAQRRRQSKLTDMATEMISALHHKGLVSSSDGPVEVRINTGIKVQGERNFISIGMSPSRLNSGLNKCHVEGESRKRRAQSEPVEKLALKRGRM